MRPDCRNQLLLPHGKTRQHEQPRASTGRFRTCHARAQTISGGPIRHDHGAAWQLCRHWLNTPAGVACACCSANVGTAARQADFADGSARLLQ
jgi:hypothetical protein